MPECDNCGFPMEYVRMIHGIAIYECPNCGFKAPAPSDSDSIEAYKEE